MKILECLWLLFDIKNVLELTSLGISRLKVYSSENPFFTGKMLMSLKPQLYSESEFPTKKLIIFANLTHFWLLCD